jgi:hypothetical protein
MTFLVVAVGMAYSVWWPPLVQHHSWYWITPGDIWSTVRGAHFIGWGGLSFVYVRQSALITLPGYNLILAPVAMLDSAFGLSETAPGLLSIPRPTGWLLVGPFTLACSGMAIFAAYALARRLGVNWNVRRLLAATVAIAVWPAIAIWGHPEDVVAIGLAMFALVRVLDGKYTSAAWLLGAAMAMQLYVVMLVPVFLGIVGIRKGLIFCVRAAIIPAFFLVAVLVPDFHHAWRTLTEQPNFPTINHATPWVAIAPRIAKNVVAAGPARIGGFVFAAIAGVLAYRRRHDALWIVWLCMLVMAVRCAFETVIVPYYVMPAVVFAFVVVARFGWVRRILTFVAGFGVTVVTFSHSGEWTYWLEMIGLLAVLAAVTWPSKATACSARENEQQPTQSNLSAAPTVIPVTANV